MPRYYFDIREDDDVAIDELGVELPDLRAAEIEAAASLGDMARELSPNAKRHSISIEVRAEGEPLFRAALIYGVTRSQ